MNKKLLVAKQTVLCVFIMFSGLGLMAQPGTATYINTNVVASGTNAFPFNTTANIKIQWIYTPGTFSTLGGGTGTPAPAGMAISKVYIQFSTANAATVYPNFSIALGQNLGTQANWGTVSSTTYPFTTGLTTCFFQASGFQFTGNVAGAWYGITLQTPFPYDPTLSLIVEAKSTLTTAGGNGVRTQTAVAGQMQRLYGPNAATLGTSNTLLTPFGFDLIPNSACTNPPTAGTSTATPSTLCVGSNVLLDLTGNTVGSGQTYQWQSCPTIAGVYTNVGASQTSSALNISASSTLFYKCVVTCGTSSTSAPVLVTVNPALPGGTYTIDNTLPTTPFVNYNSFTAAVNAMACGISGPVVFNVTPGQIFFEDVPVIVVNSTSVNTLKFRKGGLGPNPVIRPTGGVGTSDAGITIGGSDYVTFDGIDINIATGSAVEYGYFIRNNSAIDGATNDSIKNCTITLNRIITTSRGIFQNVATVPTALSGANSNNVYANLTIKNVYAGIQLTGNITFPDVNNQITTSACGVYNIIGDPATPFDIGGGTTATQTWGIRTTNQAGCSVMNCKVSNVSCNTTTDGIFIETFFGATGSLVSTLANNIVQAIRINLSVSTQVNGIRITNSTSTPPAGTVLRVYNNAVSNITSAYIGAAFAWASTTGIKGMNLASTSSLTQYSYEVYNNSVSIDGSGSPTATSTAFQRSTTTAGSMLGLINNNIWANFTGTQTTPASHYAFVNALIGSATALGPLGSAVNNNDLYIANATQGYAARGATTDYLTIALWEAANATQAVSNTGINPAFLNNLTDLHVNNTALDALGTPYPGYLTVDLDCITRSGTADQGAYLILPCSGTPTPGSVSATPAFICPGSSSVLTGSGFPTGVSFQWVSSAVSGGPYTIVGGANTLSFNTGPLANTTYYKLVVTCIASSLSDSSAQLALIIGPSPTASITPSGIQKACVGNVVQLTATTNAITPIYQWRSNGIDIPGATASTFTPTVTGVITVSIFDLAAPGTCPGISNGVIDSIFNLPPTAASATPSSICLGGSSQLSANVFVSGTLTSPVSGTTNGSAATGFDITNISTGPITLHYFSYQSSSAFGTIANQSIYKRLTPMNCVFPTNVTTDPSYILVGTVSTTSNGAVPAAPTVIPLDVNITIPAGATYSFAIGGASQQYWNGSSGCPVMGSTAHLQVREGWGGTFTGIIGNRQWHGSVTYEYGDPNASVVWSPATGLSSTTIVNPVATPPVGTTTYTVSVTGTFGCTSSSTASVSVSSLPAAPVPGSVTAPCGFGNATLNATGTGGTLNWYALPTGGSVLVSGASVSLVVNHDTTFYVSETSLVSPFCESPRTPVFVDVTEPVDIILAADPDTICDQIPGSVLVNLTVSSTDTNYTYTWTSSAGGGLNTTSGSAVTANPTQAATYTCTATDSTNNCVNIKNIFVGLGTTPVISAVTSFFSTMCAGDSSLLNVIATGTPLAYTWAPAIGLSNTNILNPKASPPAGTTTYTVTVSNNGCTSTATVSISVSVTPPAPSCAGNTICGQGLVNLTASGTGDTLIWTDTIGGPIVATGSPFNPFVTKSGSYYVREMPSGGASQALGYGGQGNTSNAGGGGQLFFPSTANAIFFNVTTSKGILIKSVDIIPSGPIGSAFEIELLDSLQNSYGSFKGLTTVTNPNIPHPITDPAPTFNVQTVPINMFVPAGAWRMRPSQNPNLAVHVFPVGPTAAAAPPYAIPGKVSINGYAASTVPGTIPSAAIFGLFYNWDILDICFSPACQANYSVTPAPPLTITPSGTTSFCGAGTVNLTGGGDPGWINFAWAPAAGLSATTGATVTATPTVTTIYTLTANDGNPTGCVDTQTVTITINGAPFVSIDPAPLDSFCVGTSFKINASGGSASVKQVGFTEDPGQTSGQLFNGGNLTQRSQALFRASDLNGAGLFGPTSITSIAIKVSSKLSNQPYNGFTIKIGNAPTGCLTSTTYQDTGLTTCFTANYSTVLGWNVLTFTTPFAWNGTSDIIIESCFTNGTTSFFDQVYLSPTPGCNTSRSTNAAVCGPGVGTLAAFRVNVRFTGGTVNFAWSPPADLSNAAIEDPVYTSTSAGAKSYTVTVTDSATSCTATASLNFMVSTKPKLPQVSFVGDTVFCFSGLPIVRAYNTTGSFQWESSTDGINFNPISGATDDTLVASLISSTTYYRVFAHCGDSTYSKILAAVVNNPLIVSTITDTVCGIGQVCLSATQNDTNYFVKWFSSPSGGLPLATGNNFCSTISANTTFYAAAVTSGGTPTTTGYFNYTTTLGGNAFPFAQSAGKEVQWFVAPGEFTTPSAAPSGGMITTLSFFAGGTGNATYNTFSVKLGQMSTPFAGGAFYSGPLTTVILPATKTIVTTIGTWFTLTLDVPFSYDPTKWLVIDVGQCGYTGTGFNVYQNTLTGVRRAWSAAGCPFAWSNNDATLPGITIGLTTGNECSGPRVPVIAVSTVPPPMAVLQDSITICEASCGTIGVDPAGVANYSVFTWAPATGLSATTGSSVLACPVVTTSYTVTAFDPLGNCTSIDSVKVKVNSRPTVTITTSTGVICNGDSTQITVAGSGGGASGTLAMPPQLSLFSPNVRGYSFTAPVSFTMTGIQALGSTPGLQSIAVVKFVPAVPPPIFSLTTNAFTTLYLTQNNATVGLIPVNISINAGDVIGVMGVLGTNSSYANPAGPFVTTIGGQPVTLTRMGMQFPLNTTAPQALWTETAGSIGRVEFTYGSAEGLSYAWSPSTGLSSDTVGNPKASPAVTTTYTVTVTNTTTGCTKTGSVTVNVTPTPNVVITPGDTTLCLGDFLFVHARDLGAYSGGWPAGSFFDWGVGPNVDDSIFLVNGPGALQVIVTLPSFMGGCGSTSPVASVVFRDSPILTCDSLAPGCNGDSTGKIYSSVSLGLPPFRYKYYNSLNILIRDTISQEPTDTLRNIPSGAYRVLVNDTVTTPYPPPSCHSDTAYVFVGEPEILVASQTSPGIDCHGNSTTVTVSAAGGTPPYTGTGAFTQSVGSQIYTVTDAHGCTSQVTANLSEPDVLTVTLTPANVLCSYLTSTITSLVAGGTSSYGYAWSNGASTASLAGLTVAGAYTLTVTDAHGCTVTSSASVAPPGSITLSGVVTNLICRGIATGTISTTVNGGIPGYGYLWNGGNTSANRTGLSAGTYTLTVTDANGCTKKSTYSVTQPATTIIVNMTQTNVRCYGLSSGIAKVTPSGGSSPYSYSWNTFPVKTTAQVTGLTAGVYTCTITDAIGCVKMAVMTITEPTDIIVLQTQNNVTTLNGNDGSATVSASGGTPGYTYSWNTVPVKTTATITGLTAGTYKCTITDTKSCTKKVIFVITQPPVRENATVAVSESWKVNEYPNPTSGIVMLSFNNSKRETFMVSLTDYTGRILYNKINYAEAGLNEFMYDFTGYSKGVYFIRIASENKSKIIRIVIQ